PGAGAGGVAPGAPARAQSSAPDPSATVSIAARTVGQPIRPGFLGFSIEFQAVRVYTGSDPGAINPVLVSLIRNLTPGQAPVLRIGGDSTDVSFVPTPGVRAPAYVSYKLTPGWMATTAALQRALNARMILGVNLAANEPRLAAAEVSAYLRTFGRGSIEALEIGNEPNVYGKITVYHTVFGLPIAARPKSFGYPAFHAQFDAIAARTAAAPLAGPALAVGPTPGPGSWVQTMPSFLRREPRLGIMTIHRYPLRNCYVPPRSVQYPSVSHLLSPYAAAGLARSLRRWIGIAHRQGRHLRVDELNSVACRGKAGVSDRFASALWVTDALFALARAGVDGVNVHTLPDSAYELFQFGRRDGHWYGTVRPVYYGLQLFAQAAPAGSRLLAVSQRGHTSALSTWATRAADGRVRIVLINKDPAAGRTVTVRLPAGSATTATVERMQAPSVTASRGVTLGGHGYGQATSTGQLAPPHLSTISAAHGSLNVSVPHGSAALVTVDAPAA
ncbi:MAG: glycosyl hydrolase family 79 C-terminal domain-containing protein, partial [Solirubrobacteraceae bacterium]